MLKTQMLEFKSYIPLSIHRVLCKTETVEMTRFLCHDNLNPHVPFCRGVWTTCAHAIFPIVQIKCLCWHFMYDVKCAVTSLKLSLYVRNAELLCLSRTHYLLQSEICMLTSVDYTNYIFVLEHS